MNVQELLTRSRLYRMLAMDLELGNISAEERAMAKEEIREAHGILAQYPNMPSLANGTLRLENMKDLVAALTSIADGMEAVAMGR